MKNRIKKLLTAVLSLAITATLCPMTLYAADEATEPTKMYFNKDYQALWKDYPDIVSDKSSTINEASAMVANDKSSRLTECFGVSSDSVPDRPKAYRFTATDAYVVINLPQKEDYELKTVEVTVSQAMSTYASLFDYYYSTDGEAWEKVENFAYTKTRIGSTHASYYSAFCEIIKVPATATKFKVVRNNSEYDQGSNINDTYFGYYPGVMGFEFAYIPKTNNDTITVEAKNNSDLISFLSSGMLPDGENQWIRQATGATLSDGTAEYGLSLPSYGISGTTSACTLNAIDGYKITSFSANFVGGNVDYPMQINIGTGNKMLKAAGEQVSLTNENGVTTMTFMTPKWSTKGLTDIVITMEKVKLETSIDSAVDNGTAVIATATVSNLDLAENDSMVLIVAGYDGDRFTGAQTKTVYKNDADKAESLTATLPKGTKTVKVFLWKDLDTLESVLAPIEGTVTVESAE